MIVEIRKYKTRDNGIKNYYDNPTHIDTIIMTDIKKEGFPIFNIEYDKKHDVFDLSVSDFDLMFSILQPNKSTGGKTLEEFLKYNVGNHIWVCKITYDNEVLGGIIDLESITFNYTKTQNKFDIQFTVFGFEKEFSEFCQGKPAKYPSSNNGGLLFSQLFTGSFGSWRFLKSKVGSNIPPYSPFDFSRLNWVSRIGFEPALVTELWYLITNVSGRIPSDCTTWGLTKDLFKFFGIIYRFKIVGDFNNYFRVQMEFAFRDTGFDSRGNTQIDLTTHIEGFKVDRESNKFQLFKTMKAKDDNDIFYGVSFSSNHVSGITHCDGLVWQTFLNHSEERIYNYNFFTQQQGDPDASDYYSLTKQTLAFPFIISKNDVNLVECEYYFDAQFPLPFPFSGGDNWFFNQGSISNVEILNSFLNGTLKKKTISFPKMFTRGDYTVVTMSYFISMFSQGRLTLVQNLNFGSNVHTNWYNLLNNTTVKNYLFLVGEVKRRLETVVNFMRTGFNLSLFDTTVVDGVRYVLQRMRNIDLKNKKVETEWLSTENVE